jgi:hypothetical protein
MRRRARNVLTGLSLVVMLSAVVAWGANEIVRHPIVLLRHHDARSGWFVVIDSATITFNAHSVTAVDDNDPTIEPKGFSTAASYGRGEPDLSQYQKLLDGRDIDAISWRLTTRQWLPRYTMPFSTMLLVGESVRRIGPDGRGHLVQTGWRYHSRNFWLPLWILIVLGSVMPAVRFMRWRRRSRLVAAGRCAVCGYDLRASAERCPECGTLATTARLHF